MSEADIAASLYGAPSTTDTAVVTEVAPDPAPPVEPGPAPAEPAPTPPAVAAETPSVPEGHDSADEAPSGTEDPAVAAKMVQNRLRYLRWLCGALVVFAAVAIVLPAAPWFHFEAESTTVMVDAPGGGFEYFETDAAEVTRSGRAAGATQPAFVLAVAAVAAAFCASRRWWFAIPVVLIAAAGSGRAHPPASDLSLTASGFEVPNSSLSTAQWGLDAALGVYWLTLAAIAAAGVAAVRVVAAGGGGAEHDDGRERDGREPPTTDWDAHPRPLFRW